MISVGAPKLFNTPEVGLHCDVEREVLNAWASHERMGNIPIKIHTQ